MSTSAPESRDQYQQYCLRRLGAGILQINLTQDMIDDCTDAALRYFWDYHFDGTEKIYYKHQITQDDMNRQGFKLPDNIIGAVRIFDFNGISNIANIFDLRYQIALNDIYTLTSQSMVPYYMAMQHLEFLEQILVGQKPIRYNRKSNILWVDMDWSAVTIGNYILVEAFKIVDPEYYPTVWKDRWLLQYGTQLMKRDYGEVLKKYGQMQLPGGTYINGQQIWNEAEEKINELEEKMIHDYSEPLGMQIG